MTVEVIVFIALELYLGLLLYFTIQREKIIMKLNPTHDNSRSTHERDLISRQDAIGTVRNSEVLLSYDSEWSCDVLAESAIQQTRDCLAHALESLPSAETDMSDYCDRLWKIAYERGKAESKAEWIPVMWHEITDAEREENGYPREWVVLIDCEMPCDGQEILVQTTNGYIRWDVCYEDGEFSLDSGLDWVEDIVAWMQLPKPYREDGEA